MSNKSNNNDKKKKWLKTDTTYHCFVLLLLFFAFSLFLSFSFIARLFCVFALQLFVLLYPVCCTSTHSLTHSQSPRLCWFCSLHFLRISFGFFFSLLIHLSVQSQTLEHTRARTKWNNNNIIKERNDPVQFLFFGFAAKIEMNKCENFTNLNLASAKNSCFCWAFKCKSIFMTWKIQGIHLL